MLKRITFSQFYQHFTRAFFVWNFGTKRFRIKFCAKKELFLYEKRAHKMLVTLTPFRIGSGRRCFSGFLLLEEMLQIIVNFNNIPRALFLLPNARLVNSQMKHLGLRCPTVFLHLPHYHSYMNHFPLLFFDLIKTKQIW